MENYTVNRRYATKTTNELTVTTNATKLTKRNKTEGSVMQTAEKKVVGVRLEDLMRTVLAIKAKQNDRSLSKEIVFRLRKSLEQEMEHGK